MMLPLHNPRYTIYVGLLTGISVLGLTDVDDLRVKILDARDKLKRRDSQGNRQQASQGTRVIQKSTADKLVELQDLL